MIAIEHWILKWSKQVACLLFSYKKLNCGGAIIQENPCHSNNIYIFWKKKKKQKQLLMNVKARWWRKREGKPTENNNNNNKMKKKKVVGLVITYNVYSTQSQIIKTVEKTSRYWCFHFSDSFFYQII